jgi:hypothetical protein
MRYLIVLAIIVASCTIIPEDAIDYLPTSAIIKSIVIRTSTPGSTASAEHVATLTYHGKPESPSKIEVTWPTSLQAMRVPIFDKGNRIAKTIYEFTNGRVSKITNVNNQNKNARVETFVYSGTDLQQHIQTNYLDGKEVNNFDHKLYYKANLLDSVYQKVCFAGDTCWVGFFVSLEERNQITSLSTDCTSGTIKGTGNFMSIMPFTPGETYTYREGVYTYWNPNDQSNYYSVNDFEKSHYYLDRKPPIDYRYASPPDVSKISVYTAVPEGENDNCESYIFSSQSVFSGNGYSETERFFGYSRSALMTFDNSYDQYFTPLYYFILQHAQKDNFYNYAVIPSARFLTALTRKVDFLYYRQTESFKKDAEPTYLEIEYNFSVSK